MTTQTATGQLRLPAGAAPAPREMARALGASLLIALSAQVSLPLPFTPVPLTLQTLAVILVSAALGGRSGPLAVLLYLLEGAAGLPVFAGGQAGPAHLLGPTGGYLAGFLAAAAVTGTLSERGWTRRLPGMAAALLAAEACIFLPGMLWLGGWTGSGQVVRLGLAPFLPGEALKLAAAAAALAGGLPSRASRPGSGASRRG